MITDVQMPDGTGLDLLRLVQDEAPETVVIVMTAFASTETAIEAMKAGAYDYVTKPFKVDEMRVVVEKALEKKLLSSENRRLRKRARRRAATAAIVGTSAPMRRVLEFVAQVADNARQRADQRRERHRQGGGGARRSTAPASAATRRSWRSTAARSPRTCSSRSSSGT